MSKRIPIIAANWKMYKTGAEAEAFLNLLKAHLPQRQAKILIAPSFTALPLASSAAEGTSLVIGAQNMHEAEDGAFTGEISARMIKDAGARFVIVGHSERRRLFHETDAIVFQKLQKAFSSQLLPILCIGETLEEREAGKTFDVLSRQLSILAKCPPAELVVAYEPVWAIGTGKTATAEIAQEAHAFCRQELARLWGQDRAAKTSILYGGSVTPETAPALSHQHDIDGALVGGASLDVNKFIQIIQGFLP